MAHITIRQTQLVFKNGNKAILEENEYEFCDDLWRVIKEFAGIYSFNINWDKVLLKNQHYLLQRIFRFTFTDGGNQELPACHFKKSECVVRRQFWQKVNKGEFKKVSSYHSHDDENLVKYNKKWVLEKLFNTIGIWTLPKEFQVGDEIQFYR